MQGARGSSPIARGPPFDHVAVGEIPSPKTSDNACLGTAMNTASVEIGFQHKGQSYYCRFRLTVRPPRA